MSQQGSGDRSRSSSVLVSGQQERGAGLYSAKILGVETETSGNNLPTYSDLILPTIRAVSALGGSAKAREITARLIEDLSASEDDLAIQYPSREKSVLVDRMDWARSYSKLGGALESPSRGVFLLTPLGKELVRLPQAEANERVLDMDRRVRSERRQAKRPTSASGDASAAEAAPEPDDGYEEDDDNAAIEWRATLLKRLHRLTPDAFEEFVLYVLRLYGLELDRVGGSGDEGIDGIGTAPISPVLSSRVAVQVKRYDPEGRSIGREVVALFQRDAQTQGAERAILVTLGKFSAAARKAAHRTTPTVDLIDGLKLTDLLLEQGIGVRLAPRVDEAWFDRFD